jgi:hypothetical protein
MFRALFKNKAALPTLLGLAAVFLAVPHFAHAGLFDILATPVDFVTRIYSSLFELVLLPLAGGILYLAGMIFDAALYFSLHTAYIFSLSTAIDLGWVIVRDVVNIFFIFILIYISLGTIVNGLRFGTMNMLKNVIIAALLINFSLFITKAVIDVSNIFGLWLYSGVQKTLVVNSSDKANPTSISGLIVARLNITSYWASNATPNATSETVDFYTHNTTTTFIRLAVLLITTYILLYASILFMTRAITLLFLLVFAPIGFMGDVLPQISEYSKEWRSELTSAAMFPIVFLLMLYISLQFIGGVDTITKAIANSGTAVGAAGTVSLYKGTFKIEDLFQYFLIIFLLQATLKVSKKYSGEIGQKASGMAESLGKLAIGASTGLAGFAGRRLIGAAASTLSQNGTLNDMAAGKVGGNIASRFLYQAAGKGALGAARGTAKSSFDVNGIMGGVTGIATPKPGGKDGYKGSVKALEEKEKKYAEEFGDDAEGIERRMAYAENRRRSVLNRALVNPKAAAKIGDKVLGDAGTAATKAATEKSKGETQAIKNQMVGEQMAIETLNRANKMEDTDSIDTVLEQENLRIDRVAENSRNNPKNELLYNRYKRSTEKDQDKIKALDDEFNEKTATMLEKDKQELIEDKKGKIKAIKELEDYVEAYKKELAEALNLGGMQAKKSKIASITDKEKGVISKRLGKPATGWIKPTETTPGRFENEGSGLAKELQKNKVELEKARREQAILDGKEASKKPIVGDTETKKEGDDTEDGNP